MTTDIEQEVSEELNSAESAEEILDAVGKLSAERKSPESVALVNAAGHMLASEFKKVNGNE